MKNTKEKRKYIYAMIFGYSLALMVQVLDFTEGLSEKDQILPDNSFFSIGNFGIAIAIGCFLFMAFSEETPLLRVIYILATIPFVFGISVIDIQNMPYLNLIEIVSIIILLILMIFYLAKCSKIN